MIIHPDMRDPPRLARPAREHRVTRVRHGRVFCARQALWPRPAHLPRPMSEPALATLGAMFGNSPPGAIATPVTRSRRPGRGSGGRRIPVAPAGPAPEHPGPRCRPRLVRRQRSAPAQAFPTSRAVLEDQVSPEDHVAQGSQWAPMPQGPQATAARQPLRHHEFNLGSVLSAAVHGLAGSCAAWCGNAAQAPGAELGRRPRVAVPTGRRGAQDPVTNACALRAAGTPSATRVSRACKSCSGIASPFPYSAWT